MMQWKRVVLPVIVRPGFGARGEDVTTVDAPTFRFVKDNEDGTWTVEVPNTD